LRVNTIPLALTAALLGSTALAAPLDPMAYTSLGPLNVAAGTLTFDTDTLAVSGAFNGLGVVQSQGAGLPDIAVFDFSSVNVGPGVTINIVGFRPVAILSQGDMTIHPAISVTGVAGGAHGGGPSGMGGGPGGGAGGFNFFGHAQPAGGGNFSYGNLSTGLQGGSGGGGGASGIVIFGTPPAGGSGGAGGGAVELGAVGNIVLTGGVNAAGANGNNGARDMFGFLFTSSGGGGGSGGGIIAHGATVTGALAATGGGGGGGLAGGGAGGGGRILAQPDSYTIGSGVTVSADVSGGGAGVAEFAPKLSILPGGSARMLDGSGRFVELLPASGFGSYTATDLQVNAGALAFATTQVTKSDDLILQGGQVAALSGWNMAGDAQLSGFGTLSGAFSGGANNAINADGVLSIGDAGSHNGFDFGGAINLAAGSTLQMQDANGGTLSAGGTMNAAGNATVDGKFNNQGTVTGPTGVGQWLTFIDDVTGPGGFAGNVQFSDGVAFGASPVRIDADGNMHFDATADIEVELFGTTAGDEYDQLNVSGKLDIDGRVHVVLGYDPLAGDFFDIFTAADIDIDGAIFDLPELGPGLHWVTELIILGGSGPRLGGDEIYRLSVAGALVAAPETGTLTVLGVGLAGLALARRRRRPPDRAA
jgi:hypothetical protein